MLAAWAVSASAAPLDKGTCAKLSQDMQNMKALDVDKLMEKGPNWAVAHLSPADMTLIRQYIDLDEQMKFRCSAPSSLVHLKHLEDEDEDGSKPPVDSAEDGSAKKQQNGDGPGDAPAVQKKKSAKPAAKSQASAVHP
jgi:hypothetical protein